MFKVCDRARVIKYDSNSAEFNDIGKQNRANNMLSMVGKIVLIVDLSNSHGLSYRVVKPNFDGSRVACSKIFFH